MKMAKSRNEHRIAVIPGDGVGAEVSKEAMRVASRSAEKSGHRISADWFEWGCTYYLKHGIMMPADALEVLSGYDAIFLGCIGDAAKVPDHVSLSLLLTIRKGFDQYVNLRPVYLYEGVRTPLRDVGPGDIDFVVVRENVEGEYAQVGGRFKAGTTDEVAIQTSVFTRKGTERVMRYAFQLAQNRKKLKGVSTEAAIYPSFHKIYNKLFNSCFLDKVSLNSFLKEYFFNISFCSLLAITFNLNVFWLYAMEHCNRTIRNNEYIKNITFQFSNFTKNYELITCNYKLKTPQFISSLPISFNNSLVFEKCLHPKNPLYAEKGEGCAAFNI